MAVHAPDAPDALDMLLERRARASARRHSLIVTAIIVAVLTVSPLHPTWWQIIRVPFAILLVWLFCVLPLCVRMWARGYIAGAEDARTVLMGLVREASGKQRRP